MTGRYNSAKMDGPASLLPFAPLSNVAEADLPELIRRMSPAISGAFDPAVQKDIWISTHVLMGLRLGPELCDRLMEGVFKMLDVSTSSTYQEILAKGKAEGRAEGERHFLIVAGSGRLGEPSAAIRDAINSIESTDQLDTLAKRLFRVESWDDLLRDA